MVEAGLLGYSVGAALVGAGPTTLVGAALVGWAGWTSSGWTAPTGVATPWSSPAWYVAGHPGWGLAHYDTVGAVLVGLALCGAALSSPGWATLAGLLATAGLVTLQTDHLGVLYLGLELQALAGYTLVGYHRGATTGEAVLKYLLVGAAVGGLFLVGVFGFYLAEGTLGSADLRGAPKGGGWIMGIVLFKVGAWPFHFWAPPVYESSSPAVLAALAGFAKLNLWCILGGALSPWAGPAWWAASLAGVASLVVGSVGGLFQTSIGGALGYSSTLNAGYLLVAHAGGSDHFGVWLYLVGYSVGAALVGWALTLRGGTAPAVGVYYLVLNLAGLPVLPGFALKLFLVGSISSMGMAVPVIVVTASVVGAYYYLEVAAEAVLTPASGHPVGEYTGGMVGLIGGLFITQTCSLIW